MSARTGLSGPAAAVMLLLCGTWAFGQVTMKITAEGVSPLVLTGLRSVLTIPLVLLWCRWRGVAIFVRDGAMWPGLLAGTLFALEFVAIFGALQLTTVARNAVMTYTAPFWAALGAHLFVAGDRLTRRKLLGLVLAFAGLLAAFSDRLGEGRGAFLGEALALAGGALWGFTIVAIKATVLTRIAPERTLLFQLGVSALLMPVGYAVGESGITGSGTTFWLSLAFLVVVISFLSFLAWFWVIAAYHASAVAPFLFLTPVLAVGFGALLLGEPLTWPLLVAVALVGTGIWVVNRG
jgi:drug/metabolite transporter (DMT)-like permease